MAKCPVTLAQVVLAEPPGDCDHAAMTKRTPSLVLSLVACAAISLVVGGCGDNRDPMQAGKPVQGYHPERFADIPLPPGYSLDPDHDQLATTIAGGLVRRYEVFLRQRQDGQALAGTELLEWYDRQLVSTGWTPQSATADTRVFRRVLGPQLGEELTVKSKSGYASFHLRPWNPSTASP